MSIRQVLAASLAALFLTGAIGQAAQWQSGKAAAKAKAKCKKPNQSKRETPSGSFCLGLSSKGFLVQIDCKPDGKLRKGKPFHALFPVFGLSPFVCRVLGTPLEVLTHCVMDVNGITVGDRHAGSSAQVPCPHVAKQKDKPVQQVESDFSEGTVLDKWDQLQQAKCMCHLADYYRRTGQADKAVDVYLKVQKLCPGSRYDARAAAQIEQIKMQPVESNAATGEEEEPVGPQKESTQRCHPGRAHEKRVGKLLVAAHQALLHKDYYQAEKLADRALKLDPDCVAAHPLVYKMHLLSQVQEHSMKTMPCVPTVPRKKSRKKAKASSRLGIRIAPTPWLVHPTLPAIDPDVAALDKVLAEPPNHGQGLVVFVAQSGREEQEEPKATQYAVVPEEMELTVENEDPLEGAAHRGTETTPDLNEFLQELVQALGGAVEIEIDTSREDGLRARCDLQVGGVDLELLWNDADPASTSIRVVPAPTPDDQ